MLKYNQRREYFLQVIKIVDNTNPFRNIQLEGRIMQDAKKSSYWSTVTCKGYIEAGDRESLTGEAVIYINLRDISSKSKILAAIDHEANHIMPMRMGYYAEIIKAQLQEGS